MKKSYILCKATAVVLLAMFITLNPITYSMAFAEDEALEKMSMEARFLMEVKNYIKENYVDDLGDIELIRGAVKGMVDSLEDPYSQYYTPKAFREFHENTSGSFGGIGVVIITRDKYTTVVSVLEGSPSEKVGIKPGDRFVEIDGKDITNLTLNEVSKLIKGNKGTKVEIGVLREGETHIRKFEITRDIVKVNPIDYEILGDGIGYLKIGEFNENTTENLDRALKDFRKSGVTGIVLDLRNNPGGFLDQAIEVATRFVPKGPIVHVVSREGKVQTFKSETSPHPYKLVVLVNGGSASASEILAGAIKDRGVGTLVGEKTFGKATVQKTLDLGIIGGVKLTVASYTTPSGTNINKTGITPDIVVEVDHTDPTKDFIPLSYDKSLKYGDIGLGVKGLQQRLHFVNLFKATPDGVYGPRTVEAVKTLQKKKGLAITGVADKQFLEVLNDEIIDMLSSREDVQLRKAIDILKANIKGQAA